MILGSVISDDLGVFGPLPRPEMDPLTEDDALQEVQILDVRIEAVSGVAAILLEMRTALQIRKGNAGVIVASGVTHVLWNAPTVERGFRAWTIGSSKPKLTADSVSLELHMFPSPGLSIQAAAMAFAVGNVVGLPSAPPDYVDDTSAAIRRRLPSWESMFDPLAGSVLRSHG